MDIWHGRGWQGESVVPGSIPEGPDLDLGGPRERMRGGDPDRGVQSGAL
jgi:hypothetical protein